MPKLKYLNVRDNELTDKSFELFMNNIESIKNLKILNFGDNVLRTVDPIVQNIKKLTSLTNLYLDSILYYFR